MLISLLTHPHNIMVNLELAKDLSSSLANITTSTTALHASTVAFTDVAKKYEIWHKELEMKEGRLKEMEERLNSREKELEGKEVKMKEMEERMKGIAVLEDLQNTPVPTEVSSLHPLLLFFFFHLNR